MFKYSISQWMLFFYIYCLFGWIFESTYVSLKKRKFVNRGFLHGPVIPIYGEGAIMMLFATLPFKGNYLLEYFLGMLGATTLEFAVGALMEQIFKVKYWDYSNQHFNFKGYICLSSSLCWGLLSVLLAEVMHDPIDNMVTNLSSGMTVIFAVVITIVFIIDTCISAKEAWDLRVILVAITKAKEEMKELEDKLSVRIEDAKEVLGDKLEDAKEVLEEKMEETRENIEEKLEKIEDAKEIIGDKIQGKKDAIGDRLAESKEVFGERIEERRTALNSRFEDRKETLELRKEAIRASEKYNELVGKFYNRKNLMLRRNPGATSKRFYEALENAKDAMGLNKK